MLRIVLASVVTASAIGWGGPASAQVPNARSMSGLPLQVGDLPAGTVVVRVVRDDLANVLQNQRVELSGSGRTETMTTDADGRAEFRGLPPGASVQAVAVVDGQRLESQRFEIPASGGIRLLLAASGTPAPTGGPDAAPSRPIPGTVTIGGDSRVVVQLADDQLEVFYLFDFVNGGSAPASAGPFVFEMPAEASGVAVLEGSSAQATASGRAVTVLGPFAPGTTSVQMAYNLFAPSGRITVRQRVPVTLQQLALYVQKAPGLTVASTQVGDQRDMASDGRSFIVALGPAVKAGDAIVFELGGVPHRSTWPRNLALVIAVAILGAGVWGALRAPGRGGAAAERRRFESRRERLYEYLLTVDRREREGTIDATTAAGRRAALLGELERIYGALDTAAEPSPVGQGPTA